MTYRIDCISNTFKPNVTYMQCYSNIIICNVVVHNPYKDMHKPTLTTVISLKQLTALA